MEAQFLLKRRGALCCGLLAAVVATQPVSAADDSARARGRVIEAISITRVSDLDFGTIIPANQNSRVIVRRGNDSCIARRGAVLVGGNCHRAEFLVAGTRRQRFRITTDAAPITLSRQGGGASMVMDRIRINGRATKRLNGAGQRSFFVSGRLQVGANQAPGTYDATFNVSVEYQ